MACKTSTDKANALLKKYAALIPHPDFHPPIQVLSYIWQIDNISSIIKPGGVESWKYNSFESILLDAARFFKHDGIINHYRNDVDNRFRFAQNQQDSNNVYVEGIVLKSDGKAFEHAWTVNKTSGDISDCYFPGMCYFGIPFNPSFVNKFNVGYGVFSPESGIALLKDGLPKNAICKI